MTARRSIASAACAGAAAWAPDQPAETIRLRDPRDDDLPLLFAFRRDTALQSLLMTVPDATDDAALHGWVARRRAEPGGLFRMIEEASSGEAIGFVQIGQVHHRNRTGYLGILLAESARGRGLGQAALLRLLAVTRDELGLRKCLSEIRVDNFPSLRTHLQAGFRVVGTLSRHFTDAAGVSHDAFLLEHMLEQV